MRSLALAIAVTALGCLSAGSLSVVPNDMDERRSRARALVPITELDRHPALIPDPLQFCIYARRPVSCSVDDIDETECLQAHAERCECMYGDAARACLANPCPQEWEPDCSAALRRYCRARCEARR